MKVLSAIAFLTILGTSLGCGQLTATRPESNLSASDFDHINFTGTNSTETEDIVEEAAPPPLQFSVGTNGYQSVSVTVGTRSVLRVKFAPDEVDESNYGQLGVYISVGSLEKITALLSNGLLRPKEESKVFDFSDALPKTCAETDLTCFETVEITISKPNYDAYCMPLGNYFCTHTAIQDEDRWQGTLYVEGDGTSPL